ncbi:SMC-Scp complex subunit ScpB [Candidatus Woesearchaeota archaeon]|nr:SMC-Scp complex subunit ScpB [Candidatus Woesearchaeota archaeon]
MQDLRNQLEALLFACGKKISVEELQFLIGNLPLEVIKENLEALQRSYEERNSPLMIMEENDGWKLTAREKYLPLVQKINPHTELSKTIMETLAVIAWKQPIMQSEVIHIRTNKAYEHIDELEKMGFIGKEKYGRTYIIKLTQKFFDYFDLSNNAAAREVFKDIKVDEELQKKMDEFKEEELAKNKEIEDTEKTEDIYKKDEREEMLNEDEIDEKEEAFIEGYEDNKAENAEKQPKTEEKKQQKDQDASDQMQEMWSNNELPAS